MFIGNLHQHRMLFSAFGVWSPKIEPSRSLRRHPFNCIRIQPRRLVGPDDTCAKAVRPPAGVLAPRVAAFAAPVAVHSVTSAIVDRQPDAACATTDGSPSHGVPWQPQRRPTYPGGPPLRSAPPGRTQAAARPWPRPRPSSRAKRSDKDGRTGRQGSIRQGRSIPDSQYKNSHLREISTLTRHRRAGRPAVRFYTLN